MNELIEAAKAVIEFWDADATDNLQDEVIDKLRAAVERAENQEAVGFEEWWDEHVGYREPHRLANDRKVWIVAKQAERERIKEIIREVTGGFGNCDRLMEKIDEC